MNKSDFFTADAVKPHFTYDDYCESADMIASHLGDFRPEVLLVLGSGLGFLGDRVEARTCVSYADIPHFRASTAPGHEGRFVFGELRGKRVALPVCDYATGEMEFYDIGDGMLVENGPMRIPEPVPDPARRLTPTVGTLMLVPGLLFDRRGRRIGYGKGMYDRYIRRFPDFLRGSTAVGVTFHALLSDTPIPYTDFDVNLALVVTERGLVFTRRIEKAPKWEVRHRRHVPLLDRDGNPAQLRARTFYDAAYVSPEEGKYAPPRAKETKE